MLLRLRLVGDKATCFYAWVFYFLSSEHHSRTTRDEQDSQSNCQAQSVFPGYALVVVVVLAVAVVVVLTNALCPQPLLSSEDDLMNKKGR